MQKLHARGLTPTALLILLASCSSGPSDEDGREAARSAGYHAASLLQAERACAELLAVDRIRLEDAQDSARYHANEQEVDLDMARRAHEAGQEDSRARYEAHARGEAAAVEEATQRAAELPAAIAAREVECERAHEQQQAAAEQARLLVE